MACGGTPGSGNRSACPASVAHPAGQQKAEVRGSGQRANRWCRSKQPGGSVGLRAVRLVISDPQGMPSPSAGPPANRSSAEAGGTQVFVGVVLVGWLVGWVRSIAPPPSSAHTRVLPALGLLLSNTMHRWVRGCLLRGRWHNAGMGPHGRTRRPGGAPGSTREGRIPSSNPGDPAFDRAFSISA